MRVCEAALPGEVGEGDGLGEGEVFVEVFERVGVVRSDIEGVHASCETEQQREGNSCDAHVYLLVARGFEIGLVRAAACSVETSL